MNVNPPTGPTLRLLAFPEVQRFDPDIFDHDLRTQRGIISLLNASTYFTSQSDIERVLRVLVRLISPSSVIYETDVNVGALAAIADMRGVFVWLRASDLDLGTQVPIAPYAVALCVLSPQRFHAVTFARMLMYFRAEYTESLDRNPRYDILNICFRFDSIGVVAVLFLDANFDVTFRRVSNDAMLNVNGTDMEGEAPVTFWPLGANHQVVEGSYRALLRRTRDLFATDASSTVVPLGDVTNTT